MTTDCILELHDFIAKSKPDATVDDARSLYDAALNISHQFARDNGYNLPEELDFKQVISVLGAQNFDAVQEALGEGFTKNALRDLSHSIATANKANYGVERTIAHFNSMAARGRAMKGSEGRVGKLWDKLSKRDLVDSFRSLLLGDESGALYSRRNVLTEIKGNIDALFSEWRNLNKQFPVFYEMLNSPGGQKKLTQLSGEVSRIMGSEGFDPFKHPNANLADAVAGVIGRAVENSRILMNQKGMHIGKLNHYRPWSHDIDAIDGAREAWVDFAMQNLDWKKAFRDNADATNYMTDAGFRINLRNEDDLLNRRAGFDINAERRKFLTEYLDRVIATNRRKTAEKVGESTRITDRIADHLELSRDLIFSGDDVWTQYHQRFGKNKDIINAAMYTVMNRARMAGIMEHFGPNPEMGMTMMRDGLLRAIEEGRVDMPESVKRNVLAKLAAIDVQGGKRITGETSIHDALNPADGGISMAYAEVAGETFRPGNEQVAKVSGIVRSVKAMASLGKVVISSIGDPGFAMFNMLTKGAGTLHTLNNAMHEFVNHASFGGGFMAKFGHDARIADIRDTFTSFSAAFDSAAGDIASRVSPDEFGDITKFNRMYYRLSGLSPWTDMWKGVSQRMNMNWLGENAVKTFDNLPPRLQHSLKMYGIGKYKWEALRRSWAVLPDGKAYLIPERLASISNEQLATLAKLSVDESRAAGVDGVMRDHLRTEAEGFMRNPDAFRERLRQDLTGFIRDEVSHGVIEADGKTRYYMLRGTRPGTLSGEFLRFLSMFRGFGMGVADKVVGRAMMGAPAGDNFAGSFANLVAFTLAAGTIGQALKEMASGYSPSNPLTKEGAFNAIRNSAALGIYADGLLGFAAMNNRDVVRTAVNTFGGPAVGTAYEAFRVLAAGIQNDDRWAYDAYRFVLTNTPGNNLYFLQAGINMQINRHMRDYLMYEGYGARVDSWREKKTGQVPMWGLSE